MVVGWLFSCVCGGGGGGGGGVVDICFLTTLNWSVAKLAVAESGASSLRAVKLPCNTRQRKQKDRRVRQAAHTASHTGILHDDIQDIQDIQDWQKLSFSLVRPFSNLRHFRCSMCLARGQKARLGEQKF